MLIPFYHRIETGSPRISILHTRNLDIDGEGQVVDINHFDTGNYWHEFSIKISFPHKPLG